jgi:FO synthase
MLDRRLAEARPDVARVLERCVEGGVPTDEEALALFGATGADLRAVLEVADEIRRRRVGGLVTFVDVRNINFTNICYTGCGFCGFARRADDPEAEFLSLDEIAARADEAWGLGATEVCIQGGLHPRIDGSHYVAIVEAIKARVPEIHVHAFSPFEIRYGAARSGWTHREFLLRLKDAGLGTIPGTAAEILDTDVRRTLTKDKLSAEEWVSIVKTAHALGIRSTATMMYGHVDGPAHWVAHIALLRSIQRDQDKTAGFTEFVPLGFIHYEAPIFRRGAARPGPTRDEHLKVHAIARLMLQGFIDNIQVSWVKMGPRLCQYVLRRGANDFGGTLMNESISRSSGAPYGQEITPLEFCCLVREIGRTPARRSTLYEILDVYDDHDPPARPTLVPRPAAAVAAAGLPA